MLFYNSLLRNIVQNAFDPVKNTGVRIELCALLAVLRKAVLPALERNYHCSRRTEKDSYKMWQRGNNWKHTDNFQQH
jgi:hypothetical protein